MGIDALYAVIGPIEKRTGHLADELFQLIGRAFGVEAISPARGYPDRAVHGRNDFFPGGIDVDGKLSGKLGMQLGDAGKQGFVEIGVVSAAQSLVGSQQDDGHPVHRTLLCQGRLIVAVGFEKIVDGQLQLFPVGCHATQSLLGFTQLCR